MTLSIRNIGKKVYGRNIINDVSFYINKGEVVGLLGPNGAGKSTCFYIVSGLTNATTGSIYLDNQDISLMPAYRRAAMGIVYLPQESSIFQDMTVEENIMIALEIKENNKGERGEILDRLLQDFSIEYIRNNRGISLSGGERRRVEIARSIATNPLYILLDEPFAGIDPIAVADIKELIVKLKNKGIGVLITDHNVKDALSIIDRGYVIYDGRVLASGTSSELTINDKVKQYYLGENFS
jgi:lipopolysaccharide export system ATP-binding protein